MRRLLACLSSILLIGLPLLAEVATAADKSKDDDRLKNCGTVLREILDVPDDIPQDLLDKADCVVVFPSVLKAAFIVGGSYGRERYVVPTRRRFQRPMGRPHNDGSRRWKFRFSDRWRSDGFCAAGDE